MGTKESGAASARDRVLATASKLFYCDGIHATGVDTIVAESGLSKMTLYKHFASKVDLVIAVLRDRDAAWMAWMAEVVEKTPKTEPGSKLLMLFDGLDAWFHEAEFRGCAFLKAAAEFPDVAHPVHQQVVRHFRNVREYVFTLVVETGASQPDALADSLCLLMNGAIATAFAGDDLDCAKSAKADAARLLRSKGIVSEEPPK